MQWHRDHQSRKDSGTRHIQNLKKIVSGNEMKVIEIDMRNLTNELASTIETLSCVKTSSRVNETHIRVQAEGEDAFDEIVDAGTLRGARSIPSIVLILH